MKYLALLIFFISTTALNEKVIENEIPDPDYLAFKSTLNKKSTDIENKIVGSTHFINTHKFNTLTKQNFDSRMKKPEKSLK